MSRLLQIPVTALLVLSCALNAAAHGGGEHQQVVVAEDADWATRHMAGERRTLPPNAANPDWQVWHANTGLLV